MLFLLACSQSFSAPRPPLARTSAAGTATDGRRCASCDSYSRAATEKVMAMLPPTMSAIATRNSMKMRRNRLCMRRGQRISRAPYILNFRILSRFQIELAAQIADVRIDAAVIGHQLAAERLLGHGLARNHLSRRAHQQFEHAELRSGEGHGL